MRIVTIIIILITGCAGVGLVSTSDPDVKLQQSLQLISQGRYLMAKDLIRQAIVTYEQENNILGLAESYHLLGNLYKKPLNGGNADYSKSTTYFEKSVIFFEQANSEIGVVKSLVGVGNSYHLRNKDDAACQYYEKALARYTKGKANGTISKEPMIFDNRYKNTGDVINAFMLREKCNT